MDDDKDIVMDLKGNKFVKKHKSDCECKLCIANNFPIDNYKKNKVEYNPDDTGDVGE